MDICMTVMCDVQKQMVFVQLFLSCTRSSITIQTHGKFASCTFFSESNKTLRYIPRFSSYPKKHFINWQRRSGRLKILAFTLLPFFQIFPAENLLRRSCMRNFLSRQDIIYKTRLYISTPSQSFIQSIYLQRRQRNQVLGFLFSKLSRFRPREAF